MNLAAFLSYLNNFLYLCTEILLISKFNHNETNPFAYYVRCIHVRMQ